MSMLASSTVLKMTMEGSPPGRDRAGCTAFQRSVYEAVSRIPPGKVSTYAAIAAAIRCRSPRAVGQALKANPFTRNKHRQKWELQSGTGATSKPSRQP